MAPNMIQRVKTATSSKKNLIRALETDEWPEEGGAIFNEDLLPTPPGRHYSPRTTECDVLVYGQLGRL